MATLLPGMLVNARVRAVLVDGLSVAFMTYFTATVDAFHVADAKGPGALAAGVVSGPAPDPSTAHKAGERCRARVLFVDVATKRVGLTLRPHLLNPPPPATTTTAGRDATADEGATIGSSQLSFLPKPGVAYAAAIIRRIDPSVGVLLELPPASASPALVGHLAAAAVMGYAHISDVADEHVDKLEKRFKVGAKVRARVIGHRSLDGVANVSLKPSVLDQPFLSLDELTAGMTVQGEVVAVEPYGAVVKLAPGVKAICPPLHVSDVPGRTTSIKVQTWTLDPEPQNPKPQASNL